MKRLFAPNLYVALTHYPVINKNGETIASAVTNLDLHDISRLSRTYGVRAFYVITPLEDQKTLVGRIVSHWVRGVGALYNAKRREALELIRIRDSLQDVTAHIGSSEGQAVITVATCARAAGDCLSFSDLRAKLKSGAPHLLIFGTAWGLAQEVLDTADYVLEPVTGATQYNHLSVRTAAAVILDRLTESEG
ncbi:MAG: RNA methyltransferase [Thermodesulfobacteriota bacterium]